MTFAPKWVRRVQEKLARQPGITLIRCTACARLVPPELWARDYCKDCDTERSDAFHFDGSPFLPSDEDDHA